MEKYRAKEDVSYEDLDNDINIPKIKKDETVYINYEKVSFGNKKYVIRKDNDEKDKITICSYLDFNKFERVEEIEMLSKKLIVGNKYHYKDLSKFARILPPL